MVKFIKSPIFNSWFKKIHVNQSLLICTPFFTSYVLEQIISNFKLMNKDRSKFQLDILIRGKVDDFISGNSDFSLLESLKKMKFVNTNKVLRLTNLNLSAYLSDESELLIGSSNCTPSGLFSVNSSSNVEGAISTTDSAIIDEFKSYYSDIILEGETLDQFYNIIIQKYEKYIEKTSEDNIRKKIRQVYTNSNANYNFQNQGILNPSIAISPRLIPQYSNFEDGAYKVVEILDTEDDRGLTFDELGDLFGVTDTDYARKKYGEEQSKLAEFLDFVAITYTRPRKIYLTKLGKLFIQASCTEKKKIINQQIIRMEIVKDIIQKQLITSFKLVNYLSKPEGPLALSTAERRSSNVRTLFNILKENGIDEAELILEKLT